MTSPWISVESTSITISRMPRRSRLAGWTAMSTPWRGRLDGEHGAERLGVGAGDVQVDRGHRVARHPLDAVDVGAGVGDPAGDRGACAGPSAGAPMHGDVASGPRAAAGCRRCRGRPRRSCRGRGAVASTASRSFFQSRGRGDEDAEDQPAPQHDLLDVEDLDAGLGQGVEDRRGDAGPVLAGERDQQGLRPRPRSSFIAVTVRSSRGTGYRSAGAGPWRRTMDDMTAHHHAIDYVELSVADLGRGAGSSTTQAFGWQFNDYGPDYAGIRAPGGDGEVGGLGVGRPRRPGRRRWCSSSPTTSTPRSAAVARRPGGTVTEGPLRRSRAAGGSTSPTRAATCSASTSLARRRVLDPASAGRSVGRPDLRRAGGDQRAPGRRPERRSAVRAGLGLARALRAPPSSSRASVDDRQRLAGRARRARRSAAARRAGRRARGRCRRFISRRRPRVASGPRRARRARPRSPAAPRAARGPPRRRRAAGRRSAAWPSR